MAPDDGTEAAVDVLVVGDGVAGLTAALFTARHDLETVVVGTGDSILRRNAHLENFPGFPAGVDARTLLASMREQCERNGVSLVEGRVTRLRLAGDDEDGADDAETGRLATAGPGLVVETDGGRRVRTERAVAATKNDAEYLRGLPGVDLREPGKTFVVTDERGRTGVDGLYAAGRLAGKPHQAVVAAGHGAEVAVTLLEDSGAPFYHDWVTPAGYFTGRGREIPPGCEEIGDEERRARDERARATLRERFAAPRAERPQQHPSVERDNDDG